MSLVNVSLPYEMAWSLASELATAVNEYTATHPVPTEEVPVDNSDVRANSPVPCSWTSEQKTVNDHQTLVLKKEQSSTDDWPESEEDEDGGVPPGGMSVIPTDPVGWLRAAQDNGKIGKVKLSTR